MELKYEEEGFFTAGRVILFTFFSIIALLLGNYFYFKKF